MSIGEINVKNYKKIFGKSQAQHNLLKPEIERILQFKLTNLNVDMIDLYNMPGERHDYDAGSKEHRLVIFFNATMKGAPTSDIVLDTPLKINGIENNYTKFLPSKGTGIVIKSENEIALAEWNEEHWELNILFDIFDEFDVKKLAIFDFIMSEFERLVWLPKTYENSWKYAQDKSKLTEKFTVVLKEQKEQRIKEDKRQVERWEIDLNDLRRRIKTVSDNLIQKRKSIIIDQQSVQNVCESLVKDLNLIIANPKVKDLQIKDNKFVIYTTPLYIFSDTGKRYYGGEFRIELNPENSDVRFFGGVPHNSWWTDHDPHPHVNGGNGVACLGNVSSTIAELCSQMQIYALVMVCIDFLESANTNDGAGANIYKWQQVDENGNFIENSDDEYCEDDDDEESYQCDDCDEYYDELHTVFNGVNDDGELYGEHYVCIDCRNDNYHWNEEFEEYIRD